MTIALSAIVGFGGGIASGSTFPGSPATNTIFFRTDIGMLFYYDGTRWLSVQVFAQQFGLIQGSLFPLTASANDVNAWYPPALDGSDIYLLKYRARVYVASGGSALSSSHKWVGNMHKYDTNTASTTLATVNVDSGASAQIRTFDTTINALLTSSTYLQLSTTWTKTGSPGGLFVGEDITYRVVAT